MRAAVLCEPGGRVDVCDVDLVGPGPDEVRVDLPACGVCVSDLSLTTVFGAATPAVVGHEGSGVVSEIGPAVDSVVVGDHVIAVWVPPCGHCAAWLPIERLVDGTADLAEIDDVVAAQQTGAVVRTILHPAGGTA